MNQYLLIPIVVGVFVAGVGVSYAILSSDYDPATMKFRNQQSFDQMMSQNPKMSSHWMQTKQGQQMGQGMMGQDQMGQGMMNQNMMGSMMNGTMMGHDSMKQHQSMHDMMMAGISDPNQRQQMMDEMNRHHQTMLDMLEHAIDDPELKQQLKDKIQQHMMNP